MKQYVYAPAGARAARSTIIYRCVEYIGMIQVGKGSNYAKGKRYLKEKIPNCSGRAIKRTVSVYEKKFHHDFEIYGLDVYYYHVDLCRSILFEIIDFINKRSNNEEKTKLFGIVPDSDKYLDALYHHRICQLRWVEQTNYKEQEEAARLLIKKLFE